MVFYQARNQKIAKQEGLTLKQGCTTCGHQWKMMRERNVFQKIQVCRRAGIRQCKTRKNEQKTNYNYRCSFSRRKKYETSASFISPSFSSLYLERYQYFCKTQSYAMQTK